MEFNEVIEKRKTSRERTDKEVDFEAIKRIIAAGMKAVSYTHLDVYKRQGLPCSLKTSRCPAL